MPWGFVAAAVVGAVGSNIAAGKQASGQRQAAQTQADMFNTITGQEQPFMQAGVGATNALSELLGTAAPTGAGGTASGTGLPGGYLTQQFNPTMSDLQNYPGYQFALKTGGQALENANTPGVGALSGPALKSLMSFNQGMAGTQYQNAFNNFMTQQNAIFGRLSGIAGLGQNAASNTGTAGTQLGTGIAQAQAAAAGAQAGGIVGATNSISNNAVPLAYLMSQNNSGGGGGGGSGYGGPVTDPNSGYTYTFGGG
jgi:hypothetical protein